MWLQYLHEANLYEAEDQMLLRQEVMGQLDQLVKDWVRKVTEHLLMGDHMIAEANARIYTFGSYRLGVHGPGERIFPAALIRHISQLHAAEAVLHDVQPEHQRSHCVSPGLHS